MRQSKKTLTSNSETINLQTLNPHTLGDIGSPVHGAQAI
jgi:hypothetical protein